MKLQGFNPAKRSDIQDMPEWGEKALDPLNSQMSAITTLLQGQVSAENLYTELREYRAKSGQAVDISLQKVKTKVAAVSVAFVDGDYFYSPPKWRPIDQGKIRVTVDLSTVSGLDGAVGSTPSGEVLIRLKVEGM